MDTIETQNRTHLDAAVRAYRLDPSEANRRLLAMAQAHTATNFYREQAANFIARGTR